MYYVYEKVRTAYEECLKHGKHTLEKDGHSSYQFSNTSIERRRSFNFLSEGVFFIWGIGAYL
jgi:hypothetical protein